LWPALVKEGIFGITSPLVKIEVFSLIVSPNASLGDVVINSLSSALQDTYLIHFTILPGGRIEAVSTVYTPLLPRGMRCTVSVLYCAEYTHAQAEIGKKWALDPQLFRWSNQIHLSFED